MVTGHGITRATGFEFLAARGAISVSRRPGHAGDTPLSRHQQHTTLAANKEAKKIAEAFAQFKAHCSPAGRSRHSWQKRETCADCHKYSSYYDAFVKAASRQGGIDSVQVPVVADAIT